VRLAKILEPPVRNGVAQFSLILHGPADATIADGIHVLHHRVLGPLSLFISSSGLPSGRVRAWQVHFSRHVRT
jgi:hypothetical protein